MMPWPLTDEKIAMSSQSKIRLSLAALLCAGATMSAQANLITNGSFDVTPTGSGWTLSNACAGLDSYMWTSVHSNAAHGSYVRLNECGNSASDPTARQTISGLTVGATYEVTWDMMLYEAASGSGTGKSFGLFLGNDATGQQLLLTELSTLYAWQTFTATFVATSTTQTLTFAGELDARTPGGPGHATDLSYGIDNVSLTQVSNVPEPASLALAAVAIAGVGVARRRKSKS
jgi:hypothetical protein